MMRYQRLSPDCAPLSNGRKSNLRVCKEDENGKTPNYSSPFEGKSNPRHNNNRSGSSPSSSPNQEPNFPSYFPPSSENNESTTTTTTTSPTRGGGGGGGGGDVLLQWGQHKRSRRSRVVTEESSAVVQSRKAIKIHRRAVEKQGILTHAMPPPPPPSSFPLCNTKRSSTTSRDNTTASHLNRNLEERPGPKNGSPSRNGGRVAVSRSALSPDNKAGGGSCSASIREEKANGSMVQVDHQHHNNFESSQLMDQEVGGAGGEKVNMEVFEWPRIYLSLSRKEKEDDFMAMKGTKLPQRPKKRAKNVDKTLQYCFPGMWLSDLTRGRYEVREKKCVKKQKRRGLKGMESMDTDSE